ncbi:unnamed protein product, partial [marine sediment metagenome]
DIAVELACPADYTDCELALRIAGRTLKAKLKPTKGPDDLRRRRLGKVSLKSGRHQLVLRATQLHFGYLFPDVRAVVLTRAR